MAQPDLARLAQALATAAQALADAAQALGAPAPAVPCLPSGPVPAAPNILSLRPRSDLTVTEVMNEFLRAKARAGKSDRYLQCLRNSLSKFQHGRSRWPVATITTPMLERWLEDSNWSPRTKRNYLLDLRTALNWAVRRGYLATNVALAVELPPATVAGAPARIGIHTPEQVQTILDFAAATDLDLCRALALRYFAGLRSAETCRIAEEEIREKYIEVTASKAKTRRRRLIPVAPNLRPWLALGGELPLRDGNNRLSRFTKALLEKHAIPWPSNAPRHSFVSYHLARHGSAARTALLSGHTEQMLFTNYRELVTKEQARIYWAIVPHKVS